MMKLRIPTLLIFSLLMMNSFAGDVTCQNHPALLKAKDLVERTSTAFNSSRKANHFLKEFMSSTPEIRTKEELGVCDQFAGQLSCCSSEFVNFFDRLARVTKESFKNAPSMIFKIAQLIRAASYDSNCYDKNRLIFGDDQANIYNEFVFFQWMERDIRPIMEDFAFINTVYTRGGFCSMCMGVDKVADYFEEGKLVVSSNSQQNYRLEMNTMYQRVERLKEKINFDGVMNQMFSQYLLRDCFDENWDKYYPEIIKVIKNKNQKEQEAQGNRICDGKTLFGDRSPCNDMVFVESLIDSETNRYSKGMNIRRLFDDSPDVVVSSTKGVDLILHSEEDQIHQDNYLQYYEELDDDKYFIETSRDYSEYWNQAPSRPSPYLIENIVALAICLLLVVIIYWKRKK